MSSPETRLKELNLTLPPNPKPMGMYKRALQVGNMLYLSGHIPAKPDSGAPIHGKVGADLTMEQGKEVARLVALHILTTVRSALGSLDKVKRLVKVLGMVNATDKFEQHPLVINGFSEVMAQVFGEEAGVGARSAVGVASLPANVAVEIECIFEV